jgi:hypothetical protein
MARWKSFWSFWKKPEEEIVDELSVPTIDVMVNDVDPEEVTIENAYKTRWIWYHTILALELLMVNILLTGILVVLAIKL